jgi:hypothetical protein
MVQLESRIGSYREHQTLPRPQAATLIAGVLSVALVIAMAAVVARSRSEHHQDAPKPVEAAPVWVVVGRDADAIELLSHEMPSPTTYHRFWMASLRTKASDGGAAARPGVSVRKVFVEADCGETRVRVLQTVDEGADGAAATEAKDDPAWTYVDPDNPYSTAIDRFCWGTKPKGQAFDSLADAERAIAGRS